MPVSFALLASNEEKNAAYPTAESVLARGREAIGVSFGAMDTTGHLLHAAKGSLGQIVEEGWFHYSVNNESAPDFEQAGVELKVTPFRKDAKGRIQAKERLVCNMLNFCGEVGKANIRESSFWQKCHTMLIMLYEARPDVDLARYTISDAFLVELEKLPEKDRLIMGWDWESIVRKIQDGHAEDLSESDTLYLGTCPKGRDANDTVTQPRSAVPAQRRAYALKQQYMTYMLRRRDEALEALASQADLKQQSFEDYALSRIHPFFGASIQKIANEVGITSTSKQINALLVSAIYGIKGAISQTEEFRKANIQVKTIRIGENGRIRESMSFPVFDPMEIGHATWETSFWRTYLLSTRFFFVVFRQAGGVEILERAFFWRMPLADVESVGEVWRRTQTKLLNGVLLMRMPDGRVLNDLPKQTEHPISHVRPKAQTADDTFELPCGQRMTKQCFWLNREYIEKIVGV